ncbi:MAG: enoyl-CoA hydratase/isomerase family protein [Dehalococcoidia bacterium]
MAYEELILSQEEGVATITMNRPDRLNSMSPRLMEELTRVTEELGEDEEVRAVILTGAGRAFCAGADLDSPLFTDISAKNSVDLFKVVNGVILNIRKMPKAIIAAVNGAAVGGGCNLALACDIIVAAEGARFGEAFINLGLQPDYGGTFFLPRLVGPAKALELMLTGKLIDAREAERIGMVNQVVPAEELMQTARELAGTIAQKSPLAVAYTKAAVYQAMHSDIDAALEAEARGQSLLFLTEDLQEGVRAFLEKRAPQFKGR